ncbi:NADH-quinone oxidoreductase subunit G, partial [Kitasatospora sp. NPDC058965]|uniref:NADH-quinone oxidoreductase subunit G n=1 Tax=Kitasatospora sp. NPDC058965 TaxID=3346682 RepID=UPI0036908204
MTVTEPAKTAVELVTLTIDGVEVQVPKGTLVIRAAEQIGTQVPRFCDHPLLDPAGACRQCIVEIEGQRKPVASCTIPVAEGMVVRTQLSSAVAEKAQRGVMELLLINHPLDCPVCDKGGECPLQNQAMSNGQGESRFDGMKRTYEKPVPISAQVLLDRERCVLCARCTRFSQQIAGDPFIDLVERGALQQVGTGAGDDFESYFSGNTIQICPVGALTSAAYRFRSRPFDLVSSPSVCEHCSSGCSLRTDHRRGKVLRRLAGEDPAVNEEWNCDKGRFAFRYAQQRDRLTSPLVRDAATGELVPTSWPQALRAAAEGLTGARAAVLTGGRVTVEDAYAYAKFARVTLGTNDVDFRARPHSAEEADFLAYQVAGRGVDLGGTSRPEDGGGAGVSYEALEQAPAVLLAGFEPEEESPIVFLRLRKAARGGGLKVYAIADHRSRGLAKLGGSLLPAAPGTEAEWLGALAAEEPLTDEAGTAAAQLRRPGAVILVGERLAQVAGALTAALRLAHATGALLAWVPRRAGERG